jgi:transposase
MFCAGATFPAEQYNQARALYYKGSDGDKDAYEQAARLFTALHIERPDDPRVRAYYGSLRLWEASHTWALWKKNSLSKEGIQMMDSAVQADPQNLELRFVRAVTDYSLPSFFHRGEQAAAEFKFLAERASESARTGALEPRLAAAGLYFHGMFLRDASDNKGATQAWKEAVLVAPQSRAARDSADELRKLAH